MKITTEQATALDELRTLLPVGTTVHTVTMHTARSGMMRVIRPFKIQGDHARDLTYEVAQAGIFKRNANHQGLTVGGAGMDMGFHLVYSISHMIYPDGHYCTGTPTTDDLRRGCPSNDHMNEWNALNHEYEELQAVNGIERPVFHDRSPEARLYREQFDVWAREKRADPHSGYGFHTTRLHRDGGYALKQAWL